MCHTWRNGYLKVAFRLLDDKPLLLTNFLLIFFYLRSTGIFRWKTEHLRAWRPFFVFCSPPTLSVENKTSEGIGARRWATVSCPPLWPCNKVLKPNFQSIISQTVNDCSQPPFTYFSQSSDFRHKLRKYFCIIRSDCTHSTPFFDKKGVLKWVFFYMKTVKIRWRLGISPPDPRLWPPFAKILGAPLSEGVKWRSFFVLFVDIAFPCFKELKRNGCLMWRI